MTYMYGNSENVKLENKLFTIIRIWYSVIRIRITLYHILGMLCFLYFRSVYRLFKQGDEQCIYFFIFGGNRNILLNIKLIWSRYCLCFIQKCKVIRIILSYYNLSFLQRHFFTIFDCADIFWLFLSTTITTYASLYIYIVHISIHFKFHTHKTINEMVF